MIEVVNKIIRTSRKMLNEIGREPTPTENTLEEVGQQFSLTRARPADRSQGAEEEVEAPKPVKNSQELA